MPLANASFRKRWCTQVFCHPPSVRVTARKSLWKLTVHLFWDCRAWEEILLSLLLRKAVFCFIIGFCCLNILNLVTDYVSLCSRHCQAEGQSRRFPVATELNTMQCVCWNNLVQLSSPKPLFPFVLVSSCTSFYPIVLFKKIINTY